MTIADLRSTPLVFVDDLDKPILDEHDHHHLTRSLRVRPGDPIAVSDGKGRWRPASLSSDVHLENLDDVRSAGPRPPESTIGFALVKGDRSELVVQKLTELGIARVIPMTTERTVVRWDTKKISKNHERHCRIAREAAMQSRNVWLPDVWPLTPFSEVIKQLPDAAMAEPGFSILGHDHEVLPTNQVLVGPEGGFSATELDGHRLVGLPGNILRTETAAISAGVLLAATAHRG